MKFDIDALCKLREFVPEGAEGLKELDKVIECLAAKSGDYPMPSYEKIRSICLEELGDEASYIVVLPLGYYIVFTYDSATHIIWADFYGENGSRLQRVIFSSDSPDVDKNFFEYYLDHFFDNVFD